MCSPDVDLLADVILALAFLAFVLFIEGIFWEWRHGRKE